MEINEQYAHTSTMITSLLQQAQSNATQWRSMNMHAKVPAAAGNYGHESFCMGFPAAHASRAGSLQAPAGAACSTHRPNTTLDTCASIILINASNRDACHGASTNTGGAAAALMAVISEPVTARYKHACNHQPKIKEDHAKDTQDQSMLLLQQPKHIICQL